MAETFLIIGITVAIIIGILGILLIDINKNKIKNIIKLNNLSYIYNYLSLRQIKILSLIIHIILIIPFIYIKFNKINYSINDYKNKSMCRCRHL